ncbi:MAG TPA: Smr/MutS family protein [Thermoanaerobaculia bacterium]|nr:Smr/MutS family protein [Thermoanaerobaculia bacterium]
MEHEAIELPIEDSIDPSIEDTFELPIELPIEDSIDLHPFQPREIKEVVASYLDEAWERGFSEVRIIHGRGIGQQRQTVRKVLERDPRVVSFADAGPERGGWGATLARFAAREPAPEEDQDPPAP